MSREYPARHEALNKGCARFRLELLRDSYQLFSMYTQTRCPYIPVHNGRYARIWAFAVRWKNAQKEKQSREITRPCARYFPVGVCACDNRDDFVGAGPAR